MSLPEAPSLGKLRLPPAGGDFTFTHSGSRFRLHGSRECWELHHDDDRSPIAVLTRSPEGWAVIPSGDDRGWYDAIHFLAVAAFLDDLNPYAGR